MLWLNRDLLEINQRLSIHYSVINSACVMQWKICHLRLFPHPNSVSLFIATLTWYYKVCTCKILELRDNTKEYTILYMRCLLPSWLEVTKCVHVKFWNKQIISMNEYSILAHLCIMPCEICHLGLLVMGDPYSVSLLVAILTQYHALFYL